MKKRNLFDELNEGFDALHDERQQKVTLKRIQLEPLETPAVEPAELLRLRKSLNLSRAVFAHFLRTNPRTVESWEQGRSRPNPHAALLIKLVEKFPETFDHLKAV